jgi:hypothetical protein
MTHKDAVKRLHNLFCRLHRYQAHGSRNLIELLTRYLRAKVDYMASYIELVAERTGVSSTGHISTLNKDIMTHVVSAMVEIDEGVAPKPKHIEEAWALFIEDYRNHKIKL